MKRHHRNGRRSYRAAAKRRSAPRNRTLEWLEPRAMLAGTPLATLTGTLATAGQTRDTDLTLSGATNPVVLSLQVRPTTGSTLNPAAVVVQNSNNATVMPLLSQNGVDGALESRVTIALANGTFNVRVAGESNTTGNYELRVFLAGDESGNQQVSSQEFAMATGAALQQRAGINHVAAQVFAKQNVDASQNLFRTEFDIDGDGVISENDRRFISMNLDRTVPTVTLVSDTQAPTIQASLTNDTGRSNTDGITNNTSATVTGSISDDGTISSFTASIDNGTAVELGTLLGQNFANGGNFTLTLANLESIAGTGAGSLTNSGSHTLRLTARDAQGNTPASPVTITFQFDTSVPAAPTALDLDAGSDTGVSNTDNVTGDTTPTITGTAEANAIVQLFSSLVTTGPIGEVTATNGSFSITTSALAAGTHVITARATDVAGNVSQPSTSITVVVDTAQPATPTLDLAPDSDTGTVGDQLTTNTSVTLRGTTEANANVSLRRGGTVVASTAADSTGAFSFAQVALPFGATQFEVIATDVAGLTSSLMRTITRNDAPTASDATFTFAEESPVNSVVGTVQATDPNTSEGDVLNYAITAGNTSNAFSINSSGIIVVANPAAIDFEVTPTFTLTVTVTDSGGNGSGTPGTGLSDTATVTINLTDANDAPDIENQTFQIAENSANETAVGTVQATDPNAGHTITFAIIDGNTNGAFEIDPNTGAITVANSAALNFEATQSFALTVTATDNLGLSSSATVTVNLQNVNEAPSLADQSFDVPFSATAGQMVGTVVVTDPDAGETFVFVVLSSDAPNGLFTINNSGQIIVADPDLLVGDETYQLTVRVIDNGGSGLNDTATITLEVGSSNVAPTAVGDVFQVTQNTQTNILMVLTNDTDPDAGQSLTITGVGASEWGGTVTIAEGGQSIRYTPRQGFVGTERFTYTVSDGAGGTVQSMVTAHVITPAPATDAHLHANLSIFINGDQRPHPPANIGVTSPGASQTLIAPVHTEAADGRLHIQPGASGPPAQPVTVNDFFTTWRTNAGAAGNNGNAIFTANQVLDHVLASDEVVRMYVNGVMVPSLGDYTIRNEDQIVISVEKIGAVNRPGFVPIADQVVQAGSPLIIPLEGFDPNSQSITFTATSANSNLLTTSIPENNRSMVMFVQGFGQLTYEMFEGHVPGITSQMISLIESGALDDTLLHRIINGFVFQGLDPTGTGFGHPGLVNFDDEYHVDLQHNSSGLLSMAKAGDDTNSSQIFSTDVNPAVSSTSVEALRRLDFNHSIFAKQTAGENVRRQLMQVPTGANNRPVADVVVDDVEIRQIGDKAVLMLKAPQGMTGQTNVTVTARDAQGNEFTQTFQVTVQADPFNSSPFLSDYPTNVQTTMNTPVNLQMEITDAENDPSTLSAAPIGLEATILFDNTGSEMGVTTPGTTTFSHFGANFSGGTVTTTTIAPLESQGPGAYVFGTGGGQIMFDVPVTQARFFFVHQAGQGPFTATAFDAGGNQIATVNSNPATNPTDPANFETLSGTAIARIQFSGGHVDNFFFRAQAVQSVTQIDQDDDVVTVMPPNGFTGWMAVRVRVQQSTATPPTANDFFDDQVIRIRVMPAGASAALVPDDGNVDEQAVDEVFDQLGAA